MSSCEASMGGVLDKDKKTTSSAGEGSNSKQSADSGDKSKQKEEFLAQFRSANKIDSVDFMRIWCHYDQNKSGYLADKELQNFLYDLLKVDGGATTPGNLNEYHKKIMATFDINKDGMLELSEVARLLPVEHNFMEQFSGIKNMTREDLEEICSHYDKDGTRTIGGAELLALLRDCFNRENQDVQRPLLEQYAKTIIDIYDRSGDGRLSFDELALVIAKAQGKQPK